MLATFKAVLNSLNRRPYIKNINDIKLERIDDGNSNSNNIVNKEGSREEMDKLEGKVRIHNLEVFNSNYWSIRKYRFIYGALPLILTVASAVSFKLPSSFEKSGEAVKYTKEIDTYSSSRGIASDSITAYDLNGFLEFLGFKIVSDEEFEMRSSSNNKVELKVHDYEKAFDSSFVWKQNGNLSYSSFSSILEYLDTDDLRNINFDSLETDEDYLTLFDRLIVILKESGYLNKAGKELVDSLNESEKREIILTTIKYVDECDVDVTLSKSLHVEKNIFLGFVILYWLFAILMYYARKRSYSVYDYKIENGYLYQKSGKENRRSPGSLFDESLKVKEAYLAAERERILLLWDEIKKNVAPNDRGKVLTNYERKLIIKHTGDNVPKK